MRELQAIQNDINMMDQAIQNAGMGVDVSSWQGEKDKYEREYVDAAAYWEKQQATATRVGYNLDTVTFEGLTIAEIITDDTQFQLIRNGIQELMVFQAECHDTNTEELQEEIKILTGKLEMANQACEISDSECKRYVSMNFQLSQDNAALDEKVRKGAEQNHELTLQLEQKNQHIADLQNQIAIGVRGALNVVDIPQDTSKMAAEIIARKVRITKDRFKDENGIDRRIKIAENVLTGETVEYEAIYEKRYIILDATQAEQYRADEANRKAELEAQNTVIPVMEPQPEHVEELVEDAETQPIEEELRAAAATMVEGSPSSDREVQAEESEVITLESLKAQQDELKKVVDILSVRQSALEQHLVA